MDGLQWQSHNFLNNQMDSLFVNVARNQVNSQDHNISNSVSGCLELLILQVYIFQSRI